MTGNCGISASANRSSHTLFATRPIGTLVKVAISEYIRYSNALKQGALPQPQATKEQVAQVEVGSDSKIDGDEANDNDACRRR